MVRWARPAMDRQQMVLFSTTLDDEIGQDHPVRLFDEILSALDWWNWECHYVLLAGQPPIHSAWYGQSQDTAGEAAGVGPAGRAYGKGPA